MFKHYVPWLDAATVGTHVHRTSPGGSIPNPSREWNLSNNRKTHRLYRLFEFLECGDRAFGVDAWGRIPGRVNINTIWDAEILQALIDANPSMGMLTVQPTPPAQRPRMIRPSKSSRI